ncbi:MAG: TonB-dependent receptor [Deltaproteobacteria bacterium]|nr:TonB-dependent receptor [Deltaproteobacteria bacterium]
MLFLVLSQAAAPEASSSTEAAPTPTPVPDSAPQYTATIESPRDFTAASSRSVRDKDFLSRPMSSPEDILRVVPGLVLAQHQGGGKADQLFLRGFDADHGTDVAVSLDGIPVNLVSHAHGQGYADLHFLIPEVIERVDVSKGPYFADLGDFDTAGAVNLVTRKSFETSQVNVQTGSFGTWRALGIAAPQSDSVQSWFAVELYGTQGPFVNPERLERTNLFGKVTVPLGGRSDVSLLFNAYSSSWTGSGQIPQRLVDAGFLDRFDAIDPTEGGSTERQQVILTLSARADSRTRLSAALSFIRSGLVLFNDFTFQANDPVHGDEIEQDDDRTVLAANVRFDHNFRDDLLPGTLIGSFGAQARSDGIHAALWKVEKRARLAACLASANPCVDTDTRETSGAGWAQLDWRPNDWLRAIVGARFDQFQFDVRSNKPDGSIDASHPQPLDPVRARSIFSPKASLVLKPVNPWELFVNFGSGFHSNDARSAIETGAAQALPRALGGEVGARLNLLDDTLALATSLWYLHLASELVWSGDDGGTEPSDPTTRKGIDLEGRWQPLPWLTADLDLSLAQARTTPNIGNGGAIALAPPVTLTAGLSAHHPSGLSGSLRLRHIGERPGTEWTPDDGVPLCTASTPAGADCYLIAKGYTVLDAQVGYATKRYSVTLIAENLTNADYREAQFANSSRVINPPAGNTTSTSGAPWTPEDHAVQDIHFTPGAPFSLRLSVSAFF